MSALPGLIDLNEAYSIWKLDKLDFLACIGAFCGVLFVSVEIGLLVAVTLLKCSPLKYFSLTELNSTFTLVHYTPLSPGMEHE
jgi:hypothetical protein